MRATTTVQPLPMPPAYVRQPPAGQRITTREAHQAAPESQIAYFPPRLDTLPMIFTPFTRLCLARYAAPLRQMAASSNHVPISAAFHQMLYSVSFSMFLRSQFSLQWGRSGTMIAEDTAECSMMTVSRQTSGAIYRK
jgi:hypothetical protein